MYINYETKFLDMKNNQEVNQQLFEDDAAFNFMKWWWLCLRYWYLFAIGVVISLSLAYYKNRGYMIVYSTFTDILIETSKPMSANDLTMGFFATTSNGMTHVENQRLVLQSIDIVERTVDSMPSLQADFFEKRTFKNVPANAISPIIIDTVSISPPIEGVEYSYCEYQRKGDSTFTISIYDSNDKKIEEISGRFGEPIGCRYFLLVVTPRDKYFDEYNTVSFRLKKRKDLVMEYFSRMMVMKLEGTSVLRVSLTGLDAYRDRAFLEKLADCFLESNLDSKNQAADKTIKFINDQLNVVSDSLARSRSDLNNFRVNARMYGDKTAPLLSKKLDEMSEKGKAIRLKEAYLKYLKNYLTSNIEDESLASPTSLGIQEPRLISLVDQYNQLQIEMFDLGQKNPRYDIVKNQISQIKNQLSELIKSIGDIQKIEKDAFEKDLDEVENTLVQSPGNELAMLGYERAYKINDNYYTYLLEKRSEAQIKKASNFSDNAILQKATVGGMINIGAKQKRYWVYVLLGLVIPLLLVILKEKLNMAIRTEDDVESATKKKFPVIGYIRHTKHKSDEQVIAVKYPNSFFVEQLRVIRTKIEIILQRHEKITMMVSSTESGDGKTYVSLNLAGVFALRSKNVLLIDFDIRKPNLTNTMSGKPSHNFGFVNYMIGDCTLDEAIETTSYGFDFLKAGAIPPNPGEFVRSPKMLEMFEELKSRYDYIIIDTSPLGLVADAYAIFPSVDIKLMIVRSFKTNKYEFSDLSKRLYQDNIKDVYVVLNDFDKSKSCYGYGYGYGYGMRKKIGNYYVTEEFEKDDMSLRERIFDKIQDLTKAIRNIRK